MPSMRLYGHQWNLASDFLPVLGLVLLLTAVGLLAVYVSFLATANRPQQCPNGGTEQLAVVWGLLSFLILNVLTSLGIIWVGTRGTPFTPSKRWLMQPIMYFQSAKWVAGTAFLAFCIWAVEAAIPAKCWASGVRTEKRIVIYTIVGVLAAVFVTLLLTYNVLATEDPQKRWLVRLRIIAWAMCCLDTLEAPKPPEESEGQAPVQELAAMFARFFGGTDLEKSDVAAGMLLAEVMQVEQRREIIASKLTAAGVKLADERLQQAHSDRSRPDGPGSERAGGGGGSAPPGSTPKVEKPVKEFCERVSSKQQQRRGPQGQVQQGEQEHEQQQARQGRQERQQGVWEQQQAQPVDGPELVEAAVTGPGGSDGAGEPVANGSTGAGREASERQQPLVSEPPPQAGASGEGHIEIDIHSPFYQWMYSISEGTGTCITPSSWATRLAPQISAREAAEIYTGCTDYVSADVLEEARFATRFAAAAYGQGRRVFLKRRAAARVLPPMRQKLQEKLDLVPHYVHARDTAGLTDEDMVYMNYTNTALGATPYFIALHRESRTVVLAIRGTNSMDDVLTDLMDRPTDITSWLPDYIKKEHPNLVPEPVRAHLGMFVSAKAVLTDLNDHQILPILLTGEPLPGSEQQVARQQHAPDDRDRRWAEMQQQWAGPGRASMGSLVSVRRGSMRGGGARRASLLSAAGSELSGVTQQMQQRPPSLTSEGRPPGRAASRAGRFSFWSEEGDSQEQPLLLRPPVRRSADAAEQWAHGGAAAGAAGGEAGGPMERRLSPGDYQCMLQERGIDCRGWRLLVTGHSLGAAGAALVAMHLRGWWADTRAWCFCPPGGMITPNLSLAMRPFVTSVCVGKDIICRTGTVTFERLLDEMVVALARTRLSKTHVLLQLRSASLRARPPDEVFYPINQIPSEALGYALEFYLSKCKWSSLFYPMVPPGRTMLFRRLKSGRGWRQRVDFDAVYVEAEQVVQEGILISPSHTSDHYLDMLVAVLEELTGREKAGGRAGPSRLLKRLLRQVAMLALPLAMLPLAIVLLPLVLLPASLVVRWRASALLSRKE